MTKSRAFVVGCVAFAALGLGASCKTSDSGLPKFEPGDGGGGPTVQVDAGRPAVGKCEHPPQVTKDIGGLCSCHEECGSGNCVDGVCCTSPCDGTCQACNIPGKLGTCSPIPAGMAPVVAGQCKRSDVSSCGLDGTCNGSGECRRYPDGTICVSGKCDGGTIKEGKVCSAGKCEVGPNVVCYPFACNAQSAVCFPECQTDAQCVAGRKCVNGSCGKKALGAQCKAGPDCDSGFCADGVCCNTSCDGACVTCNQIASMGQCAPVEKDQIDPHKVCVDKGKETCGTTGACDGTGSCALYASATICRDARCEGANLVPMSTCDGKGSCLSPNQVPCRPNICVGNACLQVCTSNEQCTDGNVCRNGSCGPRGKGQSCQSNNQCGSGHCVDGVCCESGCQGQCKYCASPQALGSCVNVLANTPDPRAAAGIIDPARVCLAQPKETCGRNGMCNGNGGCQLWTKTTRCEEQSCATGTNTYSEAKLCDGFGACKAQGSRSCAPYKCNGAACGNGCGGDNECVSPNACVDAKCGKKPPGALCAGDGECGSNFCRQGVCCETDCKGSCFSCAVPNRAGTCTPVPAGGEDPARSCKDDGVASCDRDGACDGNGKCRLYAAGQVCVGPSCAGGTATGTSTCNGTGDCVRGAVRQCGAFKCNPEGTACYESCVDNNQCITGRSCEKGTCGLKPVGGSCASNDECLAGNCYQGFCCDMKCDSGCKSCGLEGKRGICSDIAAGFAPRTDSGACSPSAPSDCGNSGFCDGRGGCAKHGSTVECRGQSCPANTTTQVERAFCDGAGKCPPTTTRSCESILCDPMTNQCLTSCSSSAQCASTSFCDATTMSCGGLKPNGAACPPNGGNQCISGKCVNGFCCAAQGLAAGGVSCPACQSCGISGKEGTCQNLPAGPAGAGACPAPSTDTCGQQTCNGSGACVAANPAGTSCGSPTCVGEDKVQGQVCGQNDTCTAGTTVSCQNGFKCVDGACKTTCATTSDCVTGKVCSNSQCVDAKKPNGASCTSGGADTCSSGFCSDGVCCESACTGACEACNLTEPGKCAAVGAGETDSACLPDKAGRTMCNYGQCAAGKQCAVTTCMSTCSADASSEVGSVCNGKGGCTDGSSNACTGGFKCDAGKCLDSCTASTQCQSGYYCQTAASPVATRNKCVAKQAAGNTCASDDQCASSAPNCVGASGGAMGICCTTTCAVAAGEPCGNTGFCTDNGMSCRKSAADVACSWECQGNGKLAKILLLCDGSGACSKTPAGGDQTQQCPSGTSCTTGAVMCK